MAFVGPLPCLAELVHPADPLTSGGWGVDPLGPVHPHRIVIAAEIPGQLEGLSVCPRMAGLGPKAPS